MPVDYYGVSFKTQNAGTRIQVLIPGRVGLLTYISYLDYKDTGTAHTITMMAKVSETTVAVAAAAGATAITVTADPGVGTTPGAIAASDYVAIKLDNGTWHGSNVASVAALVVTLSTAIPTGRSVLALARFLFYGAAGDANHADHTFTSGTSSASVIFPTNNGGLPYGCLAKSFGSDEPMVIDSGNATNAGTIKLAMAFYQRPTS